MLHQSVVHPKSKISNLPLRKRCVIHTGNNVLVNIEVNMITTGNHCQSILHIQTFIECIS